MGLLAKLEKLKIERVLKKKLTDAFDVAGLYMEYSSDKYKKRIYPVIHSARVLKGRIEYVFTLLNGMDPKETKKKEYAFYQVLGSKLKIETDGIKKYVLTIYGDSLPRIIHWDYEMIVPHIKNLHVPIACGKNFNNEFVAFDLINNPHLLISGTTGSGKSTQLRSILMTLISSMQPDNLELYLVDMKMAEFMFFRNVQHVKQLCVTGKEAKKMLDGIINELEVRQQLIVEEGVTHVKDLKHNKVPYIVVAIDEFASMHDDKAMEHLLEIGNRGRALGIYMILSILRPDAKTIDSRLKGNLNATMGFKAKNRINANVIGTPGAENLKGDGHFLLDSITVEGMPELKAFYLDEEKLKKLLVPYLIKDEIKRRTVSPNIETWTFPSIKKEVNDVRTDEVKSLIAPRERILTLDDLKRG
ncbi:DNA translocase FtsK [bacterium LRH843]|nr:DNA translocase FtsK [bacterium LRH843]